METKKRKQYILIIIKRFISSIRMYKLELKKNRGEKNIVLEVEYKI